MRTILTAALLVATLALAGCFETMPGTSIAGCWVPKGVACEVRIGGGGDAAGEAPAGLLPGVAE